MRVLFVLKQMGYQRHFDAMIRALADRGHMVRLACQDGEQGLMPVLEGHPNITATVCPPHRTDAWQDHISLVRRTSDYVRYLTPPFRQARKLRARAFDKLVRTFSNGVRVPGARDGEAGLVLTQAEVERALTLVAKIEEVIPSDEGLERFIQDEQPDVLLISPLIDIGSGQADYIKAARRLNIPSIMVLFSWDNLSTKGLIHEIPDAVLLWNELQRQEAISFHGVPDRIITVTGAPRFDGFFGSRSLVSREDFCRVLGLDPAEPLVLYLGSSRFVADREEEFITAWLRAFRRTPGLERANVLVKPHPDVHKDWVDEGERALLPAGEVPLRVRVSHPLSDERTAVIRAPFTQSQTLFECIHHSVAVVGLNTSAELEAGILGRPVLTVKAPAEFVDGQEDTLHYHYLLESQGGYVKAADDLDTHLAQLARVVAGDFDPAPTRRFIESFLRPHGIDRPAAKECARAIERVVKHTARRRARDAERAARSAAAADGARPAAEVLRLDYDPIPIHLYASSEMERASRVASCAREPWTVAWIESNLRAESVLYDIGANVGAFTLIAARRVPTSTIVAFEPGYANFARLCDNIVLNGAQANVIPVPNPLFSTSGIVGFRYRGLEPGHSRHTVREYTRKTGSDRYQQPMFAFSLDDLIRQFALPSPHLIKLNVDGAGIEVLRGASATLRSPHLQSVLVEADRDLVEAIGALLREAGFPVARRVDTDANDAAPAYLEFRRVPVA